MSSSYFFYVELLIKIEYLDSFVLHPARFNQTVWLNLARFNLILICLAFIFCYVDFVLMLCCIFLFVIVVYLFIFVFFVIVTSISACIERLIYCGMFLATIDRHISISILLTELSVDWFWNCFCVAAIVFSCCQNLSNGLYDIHYNSYHSYTSCTFMGGFSYWYSPYSIYTLYFTWSIA